MARCTFAVCEVCQLLKSFMDNEQAIRLEEKLDKLLELVPTIEALGAVLVRRKTAIERGDLHRNTLNDKATFQEVGKRRTFIEINDVPVVKTRKKRNS